MITRGQCPYERQSDGTWRCPQCGDEPSRVTARPPIKICDATTSITAEERQARQLVSLVDESLRVAEISAESLGLGDLTAEGLNAVGLTKERVARWLGKSDCTGCERRQKALNKLGRRIARFVRRSNAS